MSNPPTTFLDMYRSAKADTDTYMQVLTEAGKMFKILARLLLAIIFIVLLVCSVWGMLAIRTRLGSMYIYVFGIPALMVMSVAPLYLARIEPIDFDGPAFGAFLVWFNLVVVCMLFESVSGIIRFFGRNYPPVHPYYSGYARFPLSWLVEKVIGDDPRGQAWYEMTYEPSFMFLFAAIIVLMDRIEGRLTYLAAMPLASGLSMFALQSYAWFRIKREDAKAIWAQMEQEARAERLETIQSGGPKVAARAAEGRAAFD